MKLIDKVADDLSKGMQWVVSWKNGIWTKSLMEDQSKSCKNLNLKVK